MSSSSQNIRCAGSRWKTVGMLMFSLTGRTTLEDATDDEEDVGEPPTLLQISGAHTHAPTL